MAYPTPDIWYKFEDDIQDSSGNEKHGTPVGSPTYSDSKDGYGRCKGPESGDGNYFTAPAVGILGNENWSWALWIEPAGASQYIFEYGTDADHQRISLYRSTSTQLRMLHYNDDHTLGYTFNSGTWYHLGLTYDGSVVRYYVDGSYVNFYNPLNLSITFSYHYICRANWSSSFMYRGKIDNYMVWDETVLTEAQIQEVMNETNLIPQFPINSSNVNMSNVIIGG